MSLTSTVYRYSSFLLALLASSHAQSQNLFANPGFEDINICTEYNAPCAPEAWYYIHPTTNPLVNGSLAPNAFLGKNILLVPVGNVYDTVGKRYYVYTKLSCDLKEGKRYKLSFYINTIKSKFYNIGFCFSKTEPAARYFDLKKETNIETVTPGDLVADMKLGWKAVEYYFTASEDASFCMIGNMDSLRFPFTMDDKMSKSGNIYYFLDEIKLQPLDSGIPCKEYDSTVKKMYDQNYRHTEFVLVGDSIDKIRPPVFVTDTISIPATLFETNKSTLTPAYKKLLDSLVNTITGKNISRIDIIGHTDNKGKPAANMQLSDHRAASVKNYFVIKLPQYESSIFAEGRGQSQPIADNDTEQGRSKNRRVEIVLTIVDEKTK